MYTFLSYGRSSGRKNVYELFGAGFTYFSYIFEDGDLFYISHMYQGGSKLKYIVHIRYQQLWTGLQALCSPQSIWTTLWRWTTNCRNQIHNHWPKISIETNVSCELFALVDICRVLLTSMEKFILISNDLFQFYSCFGENVMSLRHSFGVSQNMPCLFVLLQFFRMSGIIAFVTLCIAPSVYLTSLWIMMLVQ